ncbi:MAG: hypothetical protein A2148_09865 [Chloroflexi bacterium RBG_16_68_14]|nr:MAG: hypothetical protein A2148_09865 [Chloroflexi bacterium RBG_16_68_14]
MSLRRAQAEGPAGGPAARLYLVRHAAVTVRPDQPSEQWHLSFEGRQAAEALAEEPFWAGLGGLHTSPEPKATATAQRIAARHGLPIRIERDLREVEGRVWIAEGFQERVRRYLTGEPIDSWEPREAAQTRVRGCIDGIAARSEGSEVGVVSHGLALTLYLGDLLGLDATAAYQLWTGIGLPDVAVVDLHSRRLEREFRDAGAVK